MRKSKFKKGSIVGLKGFKQTHVFDPATKMYEFAEYDDRGYLLRAGYVYDWNVRKLHLVDDSNAESDYAIDPFQDTAKFKPGQILKVINNGTVPQTYFLIIKVLEVDYVIKDFQNMEEREAHFYGIQNGLELATDIFCD